MKARKITLEKTKMSEKSVFYETMYTDQLFCDAVLRVRGAEFMVHKIILCNFSLYFRALFTKWSTPDQRYFDIFDVAPEIMQLIIKFAYTNVLPITEENVQDLFIAADRYDIKGLPELCCGFMSENLSPQNCIGVVELMWHFYYPDLQRQAILYTLRHFEEVCTSSEEFPELSETHLSELIENNHLCVKQEKTVLEAVLRWISHRPEERQACMPRLLPKVRLAFITIEQFRNIMNENDLAQQFKDLIMDMITDPSSVASRSVQSLAHQRFPPAVLLAIGGRCGRNATNTMEAYDVRTDRWVQVENGRAPKVDYSATSLNGCVYCIGGVDIRGYCNTVHRFDLASKTWDKLACMNAPRMYASVTVLDNNIYAMGGYDNQVFLNTAERYSPEQDRWVEIAPMQEKRTQASSTSLNGKIYICGGSDGLGCLSTAECYDPQTDQWTLIASMSCRRFCVGVIAYIGKIFAVGGSNGDRSLETVEAYDPDSDTWSAMPPMLNPRSKFGITVLDDRLFVTGGYDGSVTNSKAESFDAETRAWSNVCSMMVPRSSLSCSVIHGPPEIIGNLAPRTSR